MYSGRWQRIRETDWMIYRLGYQISGDSRKNLTYSGFLAENYRNIWNLLFGPDRHDFVCKGGNGHDRRKTG